MIGDGNGLAQISAGLFVNGGKLNLAQLKNLGLIKTQAADDFTTDSAAGATAFATGKKTNNRALSVDTSGKPLSNLPEILAEYNFNSGIITTDQLTGATPASFYAHHSERDDLDQIASYLPNSKLDLFIGGGRNSFADKIDAIQASGFEMLGNLDDLALSKADRIGYFSSIGSNPSMEKGRGDFFNKKCNGSIRLFLRVKISLSF